MSIKEEGKKSFHCVFTFVFASGQKFFLLWTRFAQKSAKKLGFTVFRCGDRTSTGFRKESYYIVYFFAHIFHLSVSSQGLRKIHLLLVFALNLRGSGKTYSSGKHQFPQSGVGSAISGISCSASFLAGGAR